MPTPAAPIWTSVALPPAHSGEYIAGIYFDRADHGVIATSRSIAEATHDATGKLLFEASDKATLLQSVQHLGDALVLLTNQETVVASPDGTTFTTEPLNLGIGNKAAAIGRDAATGRWYVAADRFIFSAADAPSAQTVWTDEWSPSDATNKVPATLEANDCGDYDGRLTQNLYVGSELVVFGSEAGDPDNVRQATVCVSRQRGHFQKVVLPNPPLFPLPGGPYVRSLDGIFFVDDALGFAWSANGPYKGVEPYLYRSTDRAATWTRVSLPASIADGQKMLSLQTMFATPDGSDLFMGGLVGDLGSSRKLVLLHSSDGGVSWDDRSAGLASFTGDISAGFALDGTHIWIGGSWGFLLYSATGGQ
jgi:hypothetical protein